MFPFTVVGVIAPKVMVKAGVAPPEEEPDTPFAVAIDTAVTVPAPFEFIWVCRSEVTPAKY